MKLWLAEVIFFSILIAVSAVLFIMAGDFGGTLNAMDVGPGAFPRMVLGIVMIGSGAQIILSVRRMMREKAKGEEGKVLRLKNKGAMFGAAGIIVAYGFLMPRFGYFAVTPIILIAMMLVMGVRSWKQLVFVTAGFTGFAYVVFIMLLRVSLP